LRLQPGELGSFGGRRNLRVVWVGVGGDTPALSALAGRVEGALAPLGFPTERRPFAAHLTLARARDETPPAGRERIHDALQRIRPPDAPAIDVRAVSLMQSELGHGGARYHALASFPLE
ncbi:MAG TPA: RNA 2',3'-cyclic phosphodiesterase, partial [Dehalococcoidia bacterium]|nr:RNA 2',3'-cyclic phosphodiesterase [Dehalococcoidia bacterium]